jgi:hypothetical protein
MEASDLGGCQFPVYMGITLPTPQQKPRTKGPSGPALEMLDTLLLEDYQKAMDRVAQGLQGPLETVKFGQDTSTGTLSLSRPAGRGHLKPKGQNPMEQAGREIPEGGLTDPGF